MRYFKGFVGVALGVSLFLNFTLMSKLNNVEDRINSISSSQQHIMNTVQSQTININNVMNDIKRQQTWLSPISMEIEKEDIEQGKVNLKFQWQIKELKDNSKILFNYQSNIDTEYNSVVATKKDNGLFEANIPLEVILEPEWIIETIDKEVAVDERTRRAIEERKIGKYRESEFRYFISVTHGDMTQSNEIITTNLADLGNMYYGMLEVFTHLQQSGLYVSVNNFNSEQSIFLKEVYLKKFKNGELVETQKLETTDINNGMPINNDFVSFQTKPTSEEFDYTSLAVKVIYSNGASFENEIYIK